MIDKSAPVSALFFYSCCFLYFVGAPDGYEFTCLLTMGYPAENAFLPRQKDICVGERIHYKIEF